MVGRYIENIMNEIWKNKNSLKIIYLYFLMKTNKILFCIFKLSLFILFIVLCFFYVFENILIKYIDKRKVRFKVFVRIFIFFGNNLMIFF